MQIFRIHEDNFHLLPPEYLLDDKWSVKVEDFILSIIAQYDGDEALIIIDQLGEKLATVSNRVSPALYNKYVLMAKALTLCAIRKFTDAEKEDFFKKEILDLFLYNEVDVKDLIDASFRAYWNASDIKEDFRKIYLAGLNKNEQRLGKEGISIFSLGENKLVPATVKNWLYDYNTSQLVDPKTKVRGGFQQVKYMDTSENVKKLSKEGKDVLAKLIKVYDWLRFDPLRYDLFEKETQNLPKQYEVFETPTKVLSPEVIESLKSILAEEAKSNKEIQGLNYMSGQSGVMEEPGAAVKPESVKPPEPQRPEPPKIEKPTARPPVVPTASKKLEEPRTLMDIKADIENKRRKAQEEIDRKLEELRRKVQK